MRKKHTEQVGLVTHQVLRSLGIETPYNEYRLVQAWPEVMGEGIARETTDIFIRDRALFVKLKSPALRAQLSMSRQALLCRLNDFVGAQVIERIVLR